MVAGAILRGSNIASLDLRKRKMVGADLSNLDLHETRLAECDLSRANLSGCDVRGVNLASFKVLLPFEIAMKIPLYLEFAARRICKWMILYS